MYTPATKLIITRHFPSFGPADVGSPLRNWYCVPRAYNMESIVVFLETLSRPMELHKTLIRTGNGRDAQVRMYFILVYKNWRHLCSEIVGTGKLNEISMFCDDSVLAVIQLAKSHNMSIELPGPEETVNGDVRSQLLHQYSVFIKGAPLQLTYRAKSESTSTRDAYWSLINAN